MALGIDLGRLGMSGEHRVMAGIDWARIGANVSGPILTLAVAIGLDILTRHGVLVPSPFPLLLLTILYATLRGGVRPGLVSALLAVLYEAHFLSGAQGILSYTPEAARSLLITAVVAPIVVVVLARVRGAVAAPVRAGAGVEARRVQSLAVAGEVLAGSVEFETTVRGALREVIPELADWATVHLVDERGQVSYAATHHRDPGSDVMLHPLRRHPPRPLVEWVAGTRLVEPVLRTAADAEALRALAQGDDHLARLEGLQIRSYLVIPLVTRGRPVGALTLGTIEGGRWLGRADLPLAGAMAELTALAVDNARHRRAADEAERRYRLLFENNPQPMWVFDVETLAFLAVNDAAVRHYGYSREEFLAMSIMDIRPPEDVVPRAPVLERVDRDQVAITQHQRKDGAILDVEIVSHELPSGARRARLVQVTDVTDRSRTQAALHQSEEHLRQAQKMDAVGRLAGGIAHDFNNLLTAIQGYSEMLLRDLDAEDARRRDVEEIRRAADRGALLTRQLLAFGQRQKLQPVPVDLNEVVGRMETLVQRLVGADISVATILAPKPGRAHVDPAQIEQVIVNLVLNARDAMPAGGTLTIETGERTIGTTGRSRLRPGRYLVLSVSDTGGGMEPETQARLFQPFFTTKDPTRSAGLGLSIVYGIVRQSGGVVRISSEPGEGTTVRIYLPAMEEPAAPEPGEAPQELRGLETVLLVEDEEAVRELLRKILTRHGYTVLEARHGRDALLVLERHEGPLHLVVSDIVMPEMGGRELAERLRAERPGVPILFISGYTNDEVIRRGLSAVDAEAEFIQKPFSSDELLRRVRAVLDAPAPGADAANAAASL